MSELQETETVIAALEDIQEQPDVSQYVAKEVAKGASDSTSRENDTEAEENEQTLTVFVTQPKEKFSKKLKQAMGDIRNSATTPKMTSKAIIPLTTSTNCSSVKQSNSPTTEIFKENCHPVNKLQKAHQRIDFNRRMSGVFYAGHGRRGFISSGNHIGSRGTYTRGYWLSQSNRYLGGHYRGLIDGSNKGFGITKTMVTNDNTGKPYTRSSEALKNSNSQCTFYRSPVTRIFHNGSLRANRVVHGNKTTPFSMSRTFSFTKTDMPQCIKPNGSLRKENVNAISKSVIAHSNDGFPIIYVAQIGTISILLKRGVMIEIAVDRAVRMLCHDKFSVACTGHGDGSCIMHPKTRVFQQNEKVFCNFGSSCMFMQNVSMNDKAAVFGTHGVLFTMAHLNEAYLVSSTTMKRTSAISLGRLQFPSLDYDFTLRMFFSESQTGDQFMPLCNDIVQEARYGNRDDGSLILSINGIYIKQEKNGDVEVNCRPRHISCSPTKNTVHVRTDMVDMAVQEDDKAFVKRGLKRIHVSRSGMVVSDGNCIASMDHFGQIVSST